MSVIDASGRFHRTTVTHTAKGFDRLIGWLARFGVAADLAVAIE